MSHHGIRNPHPPAVDGGLKNQLETQMAPGESSLLELESTSMMKGTRKLQ